MHLLTLIKDYFLCQNKSFLNLIIALNIGSYGRGHIWEINLPMHVFVHSVKYLTEDLETVVLSAIKIYPAGIFLLIEKP